MPDYDDAADADDADYYYEDADYYDDDADYDDDDADDDDVMEANQVLSNSHPPVRGLYQL